MKKRYRVLFDMAGPKGGGLFSQKVYSLDQHFGDNLVKLNRAVEYDMDSCRRIVNLNGKEMTWGDFIKYRKKEAKI